MRISDEVVMKHYLYQQLWEQYEELCSYAYDVTSHCDKVTEEMKYLCCFHRVIRSRRRLSIFQGEMHIWKKRIKFLFHPTRDKA